MSTNAATRYRARIAPRKGGARGAASRIKWDKVGRVALVIVLFAVLASYVRPAISLFETWQEAGAAEERLVELKAENKRLQARSAELKTPAAALREARKLGMVGAGEQAYVIKGLK
ncbi:MAG TPA: septum formation initiator family protein [Solirubrobacterales bacterium]|nr:septum formation initiator family protein [Solirubrobacterales bacterium]